MNDIAIFILSYFLTGILVNMIFSRINFDYFNTEKDIRDIMYKSPLIGLIIPLILWPIHFLFTCMMALNFFILRIINKIL